MMKCRFRVVVITCVLLVMCFKGIAQQEYFIFLQSDQQQGFYARIGEKIYNSSTAGHLVLPGLKDSTYSIFIGFPGNQHPEMEFVIPVSRKDQGFLLKNMGEQGWNLFNFLSLQLLKPKAGVPRSSAYTPDVKKKTDSYSRLMAGVVNDTAVLYATFAVSNVAAPVVKQTSNVPGETEKSLTGIDSIEGVVKNSSGYDSSKIETRADSPQVTANKPAPDKESSEKLTEKEKIVITAAGTPPRDTVLVKTETTTSKTLDSTVNTKETVSVFRDSANRAGVFVGASAGISKIAEEKTTDGVQLKYIVKDQSGNADTVNAFIQHSVQAAGTATVAAGITDTMKASQKQSQKQADSDSNAGRLVMINSDCRHFASERDVDKLRIKILSEKKDSEKLEVVKKEYRSKCYTSRQVKALSELFNADPLRFEFLSASFPFVSDSENFRELGTLLHDPVYVEKFEGLFKN